MSKHGLFDAAFRRSLPAGEIIESQSSASSSAEGAGVQERAESRYIFSPAERTSADLEQLLEAVIDDVQQHDVEAHHEPRQREPVAHRVAGSIRYTAGEATGELTYRLAKDEQTARIEIDLSTRERRP
ncbi:MAG: hypothetical protein WD294_05675 [Phycisphaeraceae bacterium]